MNKKTNSNLALFILIIALVGVLAGCRTETELSKIDRMDEEETYPEAPGQLEVVYSDLSDIITDASYIVKISVVDQFIEMLDGYPQTHTVASAQEIYKGDLKLGETIEIVEEGGNDDKVMGGIPQMNRDNDYILFLKKYEEKFYICGAFQGRFIIRDNYVFQQANEDVKLEFYNPTRLDEFSSNIKKY